MGKPAARLGDMHTCPQVTLLVPHVGGPTVLIGGQPAATMGNQCLCVSPAPDIIQQGSATVKIGGQGAARLGDATAHGGMISAGFATVLIGD